MKINKLTLLIIIYFTSINCFSQDGFIGEIRMFAGNFAPRGWAFCDGSVLPINNNTAIFSILGTTYGGNGSTNFALPDMRGRSAVHDGQGPGLPNVVLGERGGSTSFTILESNLPPHSHTGYIRLSSGKGTSYYSNNGYISDSSTVEYKQYANPPTSVSASKTIQGVQTNVTGGGQSVNNRSPYLAVKYIICMQGIFPSRN